MKFIKVVMVLMAAHSSKIYENQQISTFPILINQQKTSLKELILTCTRQLQVEADHQQLHSVQVNFVPSQSKNTQISSNLAI